MWPDWVLNPGPLTYESGALLTALRRPAFLLKICEKLLQCKSFSHFSNKNISVFGYKVIKHLTS